MKKNEVKRLKSLIEAHVTAQIELSDKGLYPIYEHEAFRVSARRAKQRLDGYIASLNRRYETRHVTDAEVRTGAFGHD